MKIHGWGRYPVADAAVELPQSASQCATMIGSHESIIARGLGRSYGDSANAQTVLQTDYLDHYIRFDHASGQLTCEAGVTINEILQLTIPHGWFIPVTPGTSFVTIGGAIASDVHGKNHHVSGTFSQHLLTFQIALGTGDTVTVSRDSHPDLFLATCGGMGLTGVIVSATIQLMRITSSNIVQTTIKANCLEELFEQFDAHNASTYSVAWIDCLTSGRQLGRSLLMLGEHANDSQLQFTHSKALNIPVDMPTALLNSYSIKAFNNLYFHKAVKKQSTTTLPYTPYFYPLDALSNWNRLYGKNGFLQYQFVLPRDVGAGGMRQLLKTITDSGKGSFLAVLKAFGPANNNYLSFPIEGYTLALDFMLTPDIPELISRLDGMVASFGGRIYLTKDAFMSEQMFKTSYPAWEQFEQVREKFGAIGKFASHQSKRLGLK